MNLRPGESISFSTAEFLPKNWNTGEMLDHGEGNYVYELSVNMLFAGTGEDDGSWATYSIYLMLDEDAVTEIENGNPSTEPTTPENPDTPEEYSPAIEVRDKILEGQTRIDLKIYVLGVTFNQEQSIDILASEKIFRL